MKRYTKPEIKINCFETKDVITTSCTCPSNCTCKENVWGLESFYYHDQNDLLGYKDNLNAWDMEYDLYATGNFFCPDHGAAQKANSKF